MALLHRGVLEPPVACDDVKACAEAKGDPDGLHAVPTARFPVKPHARKYWLQRSDCRRCFHDRGAQQVIGAAHPARRWADRPGRSGSAKRYKPGAAGDRLGGQVVLDRPHLAGEVGGGDDVDAGNDSSRM